MADVGIFWLAIFVGVAIAIAVLAEVLKKAAPQGEEPGRIPHPPVKFSPTHVCGNCRMPIQPVERAQGSGAIEVLLWLFFLVPGIIYSIWRASSRKPICPYCAAPHPIPLGTPAAEALIAR